MKKIMFVLSVMMVLCLCGLNVCAQEGAQEKEGIVKKVDVKGKCIVVMVQREMTFSVTDKTKIHQGKDAKKLPDIKVDDKVKVAYSRSGDNRVAKSITIQKDK